MASPSDSISMALFCDFENVALGVRDAQYEKFDIKPILERLLLKGSIVVKKAYCDWERYKGFKATMHEANFELIEIPHVRQSGKNSADIRLVVDALDLCYTKSHVNTFVIISGDSDFSPLVSKLRENNKQVIGVGVKQSTSDLLIANCDEFIFYDDLVRENQRAQARRQSPGTNPPPAPRRSAEEERSRKETQDARRTQGVELAAETFEALLSERGDTGKIWASVLKEAIKRRKPDFSEGRYGFRTFGNLLEEAQARGLLEFGRDEKSGAYVYRNHGLSSPAALPVRPEMIPEAGSEVQQGQVQQAQGQGRAMRHDFHAVVTAPDLNAAAGEDQAPSGRQRGRRNAGADRASPRPAPRSETIAAGQAEPTDGVVERPASRYFSQPPAPAPEAVPAMPLAALEPAMDAVPADSRDGMDAPLVPAVEGDAAAATPRRSRARSADTAKAEPRPRGTARKPAAPRTRAAGAPAQGGEASAAAASEGGLASPPVAPESGAADAPAAAAGAGAENGAGDKAPAARPRSRARKAVE